MVIKINSIFIVYDGHGILHFMNSKVIRNSFNIIRIKNCKVKSLILFLKIMISVIIGMASWLNLLGFKRSFFLLNNWVMNLSCPIINASLRDLALQIIRKRIIFFIIFRLQNRMIWLHALIFISVFINQRKLLIIRSKLLNILRWIIISLDLSKISCHIKKFKVCFFF